MDKPRVSIIIPTYNEAHRIKLCLDSILNQTFPKEEMEIIIVDGMSTDSTRDIILSYIDVLPIKLFDNKKRIVTYALNIGIDEAVGDYIIRMDAHAEFPSDYIEKCLYYLDRIDADNVGGILITKGEGYFGEANAELLSSRFGVGNSQFRVGTKSGYVDTVPFGAFRAEIFKRIGNFNVNLPRSEDNDFNSRIIENGGKVFLANDISLTYYCRDDLRGLLKQGALNGNALFLTLKVNPSAMKLRHFVPFAFVCSIIFLPLLSVRYKIIRRLLLIELLLYGSLDLYFSFFAGKLKFAPYKILAYPLFHLAYGCGSVIGLFNIKLK